MQLDQHSKPTIPLGKLQLHSRKCHHTYNATRHLPKALWIRSLRFGDSDFNQKLDLHKDDCVLFYEVILYYDHNRACTLYRTPDDFRLLKSGIGKLSRCNGGGSVDLTTSAPPAWGAQTGVEDVEVLQRFLCEAIRKKGKNCALEHFLRRRMEDCGGA